MQPSRLLRERAEVRKHDTTVMIVQAVVRAMHDGNPTGFIPPTGAMADTTFAGYTQSPNQPHRRPIIGFIPNEQEEVDA